MEGGVDAQTIANWQGHQDGGVLILQVFGKVISKHKKIGRHLSLPLPHPNQILIPTLA